MRSWRTTAFGWLQFLLAVVFLIHNMKSHGLDAGGFLVVSQALAIALGLHVARDERS